MSDDDRLAVAGVRSPYGHTTTARCLRNSRFEAAYEHTQTRHADLWSLMGEKAMAPAPTDTCRCNGGHDPC